MPFNTISIIGLGYIGLPTAAMFASRKINVIGVDINQHAVDTINEGKIHIIEPDLDIAVHTAVTSGYLRATTTPEPAEAFIIAVPTPFLTNTHEPDLRYIRAASDAIAPVLTAGNLVVLESTSPVGSTELLSQWLATARPDLTFPHTHRDEADIRISYCPERVLPGHVMRELIENDRVIGGLSPKCSKAAESLYKIFVQGTCVITNARTAEMCKLTENSFRDVNIAFANELSIICDTLQINVWELIALANRHPRVKILQPGPGVGGHCIAVDPWFIVSKTPEHAKLIHTARTVNDGKPLWVIEKIKVAISDLLQESPTKTTRDITVACYGLAFKPDIDDLRESPALQIATEVIKMHAGPVLLVEPNTNSLPGKLSKYKTTAAEDAYATADIHILLVDHSAFKTSKPQTGKIIDTKGIW